MIQTFYCPGLKLGGLNTKKSYPTASKAGAACVSSAACTGFVLHSKKYYLASSWHMFTADGYTSFMRNDEKHNYLAYSTLLYGLVVQHTLPSYMG